MTPNRFGKLSSSLSSWFSVSFLRMVGVFLLGALLTGIVAYLFTLLEHRSSGFVRSVYAYSPLLSACLLVGGVCLATWLRNRFFSGTQGTGIPQTIASLKIAEGPARDNVLSWRIAFGKLGLTALGLFSGASLGREGPTVQIGASIMHAMGKWATFPAHLIQRGLILSGGAAGIAASFNAPIAGIVFAFEEIGRSFEKNNVTAIVLTVAIACQVVIWGVHDDYLFYGSISTHLAAVWQWTAVIIIGTTLGLLGGAFSQLLWKLLSSLARFAGHHPMKLALGCGLALAVLSLLSGGFSLGSGFFQARQILIEGEVLPWYYGPVRMLATFATLASGVPGGLFDPTLSAGAGFGQLFTWLFPTVPVQAILLIAMVSYFSGVVQSPITASVILVEMTGATGMILPLLVAAFIAYQSSRLICRESLYERLSAVFLRTNDLPTAR